MFLNPCECPPHSRNGQVENNTFMVYLRKTSANIMVEPPHFSHIVFFPAML